MSRFTIKFYHKKMEKMQIFLSYISNELPCKYYTFHKHDNLLKAI